MRALTSAGFLALLLVSAACGDGATTSGDGVGAGASTCETDPLKTGLTAQQTGVSADAFDCAILAESSKHSEPDPMIFKAIIYVESRFDKNSVACPNDPCGVPDGWSTDESGCFGLMQIVPACTSDLNKPGLLPNGHPGLSMDDTSSDYATSVFNPSVNIEIGIAGFADNRKQVEKTFSGCTEEQYTLMAMGNYNSYGSTKSCTEYNTDYDNLVLDAYHTYAMAAGYAEHDYPK